MPTILREVIVRRCGPAMLGLAALAMRSDDNGRGVEVKLDKTYTTVSGSTWEEISRAVTLARRAIDGSGKPYEGVTGYRYDIVPETGCSPANATIRLTLTIQVPGLPRDARLNQSVRECWANYERNLTEHEEGHGIIASHYADVMSAEIAGLSGASCGDLHRVVAARFAEMEAEQRRYDAVTVHGNRQWRADGLVSDPDPARGDLTATCLARAGQG